MRVIPYRSSWHLFAHQRIDKLPKPLTRHYSIPTHNRISKYCGCICNVGEQGDQVYNGGKASVVML